MQPLHDNKQWILHVTATRIAAFRDEQEVYDAISEYIHSPYISESSLFSFVPDIKALAESIPGSPLFEETLDLGTACMREIRGFRRRKKCFSAISYT